MAAASNDVLSWTNQDSRESALFNSWGVVYRFQVGYNVAHPWVATMLTALFQTTVGQNGQSLTTMWRALRPNKEDRIAKLEWAPNGGLGRVMMGKVGHSFYWPRLLCSSSVKSHSKDFGCQI